MENNYYMTYSLNGENKILTINIPHSLFREQRGFEPYNYTRKQLRDLHCHAQITGFFGRLDYAQNAIKV